MTRPTEPMPGAAAAKGRKCFWELPANELVEYFDRLVRLLVGRGLQRHDAEELAQIVLQKVGKKAPRSYWRYLQRAALNASCSLHVRRMRADRQFGRPAALDLNLIPDDGAWDRLSEREQEEVRAKVQELPPDLLQVVKLVLQGRPHREIKQLLHLTDATFRRLWSEARAELRHRLRDFAES